ncbi:MAG TPA: glutamate synthase subunit beta [Streptosporangiaceae bacterium]|nr:glutamate synthase subunit beta [Streptosporangiaceae bacterium]
MADPTGFMSTRRQTAARRPVDVRIQDWREVYVGMRPADLERQAGRCMDCGIPFCHNGCPLGNLIPEWNDLVWQHRWQDAAERLHATNNFPEFTGRLCPAPCETACVLGINADPVAIKQVEVEIIDRAWAEGWVTSQPSAAAAGQRVAVIGSGPAGLAAAQQLTRAGHAVTVFEQADQPGGLLRYGIPEFKLEKRLLDRRLAQLREEGTIFRCGVRAGPDVTAADLRREYQAIVLACGARAPRELPVPGADLAGIHQAMDYLTLANQAVASAAGAVGDPEISARGRHVVIIGGGDTGADCLGTALRQGAASVTQLEIMPKPPKSRPDTQPWPTYPMIYRVSGAHEEGGERVYAVSTQEFVADDSGRVRALRVVDVELAGGRFAPLPGTEREIACDLVLLALGFRGAEDGELLAGLGVGLDERGSVPRDDQYATAVPGVFVAGDMGRGQSLIVWAIAEGRSAAAAADRFLTGQAVLPVTIPASASQLRVSGG